MKLDGNKIEIAMANRVVDLMELSEIGSINYMTLKKAINGREIKPTTAGKIAKALNVRVEDLLED